MTNRSPASVRPFAPAEPQRTARAARDKVTSVEQLGQISARARAAGETVVLGARARC